MDTSPYPIDLPFPQRVPGPSVFSEQHFHTVPLSYGQRALWFLYQLAPDNPAYNSNLAASLNTELDVGAFRRTFQRIVGRHAALRTTFTMLDDEPVQRIQEQAEVSFQQVNAAGWSDAYLHEQVVGAAQRPFDLERDAVFQVLLFTRAANDHVFLIHTHHIVVDYTSCTTILKELGDLYYAEKHDLEIALPPSEAQYEDFVYWQAQMLESKEGLEHRAYWETQFRERLPTLNLPAKTMSSREQRYIQVSNGGIHTFMIEEALVTRLKVLAQAEGASLFMLLLAAFHLLLAHYCGQTEVPISSFVHGRSLPKFRNTFGYFINTIVLKTTFEEEQTFSSLLAQVRQLVLDARKHSDFPASLLLERLQLENQSSSASPFQVVFNMIKAAQPEYKGLMLFTRGQPGGQLNLSGLMLQSYPIGLPWAQFDLTLTVEDDHDLLYASLEYNKDILSSEVITRMAIHLRALLESIVDHPQRYIGDLSFLQESERQQLLVIWNATAAPYPRDHCLHQLFEAQVNRTPQNIAAIYGDESLTYVELDQRANQLAHYLRTLGVVADTPVGVCLDRSLSLLVAILGVLKAGGAFLPLDTSTPPMRINRVLQDAKASLCLFQRQFPVSLSPEIIPVLVDERSLFEQNPVERPHVFLAPDNLVSIYYTSGSTGTPKGVSNTHRGWVSRMTWMQQHYQLSPQETVLQKTTLTFDDAAVEIIWPLIVGARVALLPPELHKDPQAILQAAIRYQVAVLQFVPSMLTLFIEAVSPREREQLQALRIVISSGEALRVELVQRFFERVGCGLYNQYGPTEVSIDSTMHQCCKEDQSADIVAPIGRPIANHRVYLLNQFLQPVPPGIIGEIYLAGDGLARGYLRDPGRTAASFIPNPFEPGERLYRTGDSGRYLSDGSLIFLGRIDDQVKIRGQRVELAEIEASLAAHPAVQECAVLALKRLDGYRLVAYYLPVQREQPESSGLLYSSLHSFLSERLPDYMVPSRFVQVDIFPTASSGKLDRGLLPDPGDERPGLDCPSIAPVTPLEKALAAIWQDVLGVSNIGVEDNFFDLGGHSLDVTRIVSRINQQFAIQLAIQALFESPTIAKLVPQIEHALQAESSLDSAVLLSPIAPQPAQDSYELSPAQQRLWFAYQLDSSQAYGAILTLEIAGPFDPERFACLMQHLVRRHSILRTTVLEQDGVPRQMVHATMDIPSAYSDLKNLSTDEQRIILSQYAVSEVKTPFDLAIGPLLRARLFRLAETDYRLLLSMHPIACDGWCVNILLSELRMLYQAENMTEPPIHAHPLPLQYYEYAMMQNQWLANGALEFQRAYWLEQLSAHVQPPALPYDDGISSFQDERTAYRMMPLGEALTAKLNAFARMQNTTLYITLLTGLKLWLACLSGQTTITIGSPVSGRSRPEFEEVLGVFVNPVALRTDLAGNPTCLEALQRVSQSALGAFANQDYPFDLVIQDQRQHRDPGGEDMPFYSVVFVLQNASKYALSFDNLVVRCSLADRLAAENTLIPDDFHHDSASQIDLHIEVRDLDGQLTLLTQYNHQHFEAATVDRFHRQLIALLEQVLSNPRQRLSQLELVDLYELDDLFHIEP